MTSGAGGYRNVVLGFLVVAYTLNFIDRSIVAIIGQAIKVDLKLTDTQLGLLGGLAFALLYTSFGLPIARIAERANRVRLISIAIIVWSGFTALCGLAQNFVQLLVFRAGVGVGEAGLSPAAHSLISDYFEPRRRASALAIYALGIPIGSMIGVMAGGWIAQSLSWRWAFMLVGLPGLLIALAFLAFVRDPRPRRDAAARASAGRELAELWAVARTLIGRGPTLHVVLGVTIVSFADYGIGTFAAPYFIRMFDLDLATVGFLIGVVGGVSTGLGTLLGGLVADWAGRRILSAYALVPAVATAIAAPFYMAAYALEDWRWAFALLLLPGIFAYAYLGPCFAVVQNSVEPHRRATATALLLFIVNLIGLGLGPAFVGWLIDQLAGAHFAAPGALDLWPAVTAMVSSPAAAEFAASCPGGLAPTGAGRGLADRCAEASALGARHGILITFLLFFWASLHFFLAARGLGKMMREAS